MELSEVDYTDKQSIFDFVVEKLLTQKERSVSSERSGFCAYRGNNDCKCAFGWLIPDDRYTSNMEGSAIPSTEEEMIENLANQPKDSSLWHVSHFCEEYGFTDQTLELCKELQLIHDGWNPSEWCFYFKNVASRYNLNWNEAFEVM